MNKVSFEAAAKELEEIVSKLEASDLSLDASFLLFEKGMELSKYCSECLADMEKKVRVLVDTQDEGKEVPFTGADV